MIYTIKRFSNLFFVVLITLISSCHHSDVHKPSWPSIQQEEKPWTRWWWHGSAVTKEGITQEMEAYKNAGLGGLEITPIYGVYGEEDQFVNYLSPKWTELLVHTLKEGDRLGMGIDMATGTGWPFGGPWISEADACKNINYKIYEVKEGGSLAEQIAFIQQPFLRAIGTKVLEESGKLKNESVYVDSKNLNISQLSEPVSANKNLQALALDQVIFEKKLPLKLLMGYSDKGEVLDLTDKVDRSGKLSWKATAGNWKLYALFEGWHGKMVERAAPGGEGNVIDHFSSVALKNYLNRFDEALAKTDISSLRAFFNDSYEVDDARGTAGWTPTLLEEFKKRRGYDLQQHLPALFGHAKKEENERILCDYRETISELLLANFTLSWKAWAHTKSAVIRNQAHGSPANILDLYAAVDIPEIEGIEPLRIRMAASAGNVTGKKLVSAEAATWLNEHFESNLGDIKNALDNFFLNGVNHIFYHGTCYSPPGEVWPGRLFYAAVHLNPRNSQWNDFHTLNEYVARCQAFLQRTKADNDILLYYPFYDPLSTPSAEMMEHFDGIERQFKNTTFEKAAKSMLAGGYTFDYISDKQIMDLKVKNDKLMAAGAGEYKTIIVPHCRYIPIKTFQKILSLAEEGATIITLNGLPESVSGYSGWQENKTLFNNIVDDLNKKSVIVNGMKEVKIKEGNILSGDSLSLLLDRANVQRENLVDAGLKFIRKRNNDNSIIYFVTNSSDKLIEGWIPFKSDAESAILYDPLNKNVGKARIRKSTAGKPEVYMQLERNQTIFIEFHNSIVESELFLYRKTFGTPLSLNGPWNINFLTGGPALPPSQKIDKLSAWTDLTGQSYAIFSGTAVYTTSFSKPSENAIQWLIDLGDVKESAEISLNGEYVATLIGPPYQFYVDDALLKANNVLEVKVSNLMANRIADLDKRGVLWKRFYNVNFPARKAENRKDGLFDASNWQPRKSGLIGPVTVKAIKRDE